jgi:hypothetical protein
MFGEGTSGAAGINGVNPPGLAGGGSGGGQATGTNYQIGGLYGGGGGGSPNQSVNSAVGGDGAQGVVRILFGTIQARAFPSTNVALADSDGNVTVI